MRYIRQIVVLATIALYAASAFAGGEIILWQDDDHTILVGIQSAASSEFRLPKVMGAYIEQKNRGRREPLDQPIVHTGKIVSTVQFGTMVRMVRSESEPALIISFVMDDPIKEVSAVSYFPKSGKGQIINRRDTRNFPGSDVGNQEVYVMPFSDWTREGLQSSGLDHHTLEALLTSKGATTFAVGDMTPKLRIENLSEVRLDSRNTGPVRKGSRFKTVSEIDRALDCHRRLRGK